MFYYPHHIGDYKAATTYLSNEEDLAYRRLLELYYDTEKAIEDDVSLLSKRLRVTPEALSFVLKEFFSPTRDGWRNKRCDVVIRDYQEMVEKNRKNGKAGGRPKANKQATENPVGFQSVPSGIPVVTQVKANQEPITKNQEPILREDSSTPSREAGICVVMKSMGIGSVNPQHPKLSTLLADGATVADFESAARIAVEGGKGFAYALGVVEGIRADAKRPPKPIIETFRERDSRLEAERMAEFAPGVARKTGLNSVQNFSKTIDAEVKNVTAIASR